MIAYLERARGFLTEGIWRRDAWWIRFLQLCVVIVEGFVRDQLLLRAHSLTYISMLSLIPVLALAISMVGVLGIKEDLLGLIVGQLAAGAPGAAERITQLVERVNFGSLGTVGAVALLATTLLAIGNVERSLNHIWGIGRQRSWVRRFPDYLAVVVIAPVVLGVAISVGATLRSQAALGRLLEFPLFALAYESGLKQLPLVMMCFGFAFIYWFMPNTRVNPISALLGGLVAGLLFSVAQSLYVGLSVGVAKWDALFGGLAILPLLIVWIYVSWAIFLLGAEVAFAHQNLGRYRREVKGAIPGPAAREAIGLAVAVEVASRFETGAEPWTADGLADELDVRVRTVRAMLEELEDAGILSGVADERQSGAYQLARPAERISVGDVLRALRGTREGLVGEGPVADAVGRTFEELEKRQQEICERETLADLLSRCAST